jgi:hypothetical protein
LIVRRNEKAASSNLHLTSFIRLKIKSHFAKVRKSIEGKIEVEKLEKDIQTKRKIYKQRER